MLAVLFAWRGPGCAKLEMILCALFVVSDTYPGYCLPNGAEWDDHISLLLSALRLLLGDMYVV